MRDAFIKALTERTETDESIVFVTGDLGFGVLNDFIKRFPEQFINAGVAEQNMTAIACGMALEGHKAFTYSIGNFPTMRCLEQIRNDVCYHDANVTIVAVGAGFSYGQLGMSHFALEDMAVMRALPNMQVIVPADPWEAEELTHQMLDLPGPKYLRIDKGAAGIEQGSTQVKLGKVRQIREGRDATIIAIGGIAKEALIAADEVSKEGISLSVLVVNCLKPLDEEPILQAVRESGKIITLEEHSVIGGLGSTIADLCMDNGVMPSYFKKMGMQDAYPTIVGDQDYLRKKHGMSAEFVVDVVREAVSTA